MIKLRKLALKTCQKNIKRPAAAKIVTDEELLLGKIKYNDKVLHQSKILKVLC